MIAPERRRVLLDTIEAQRLGCELSGSPLSAEVLAAVAADVAADGPYADLLDDLATARMGEAVLLRLLAGLHGLVLAGDAPDLAAHYPSVGGAPGRELADAVRAAATGHAEALARRVGEGVQTNEVGRSATLVGGYLEAARTGRPLRILEIGASAGLNLLVDRYRYVGREGAFGPPDSPLVFAHPWVADEPELSVPLEVVERRGCDRSPIDASTPEGRRRLRSFVWADQLDRLARLDAALAVAAADPPTVDRAAAGPWLEEQLAVPVPGRTTVVAHSIVLQYLELDERRRAVAAIERAGRAATEAAPLCWLRLEPGGDQAELRLTRWPGGGTRRLARSSYHGPPVVWRPGPVVDDDPGARTPRR